MANETETIVSCQAGDRQSFAELFSSYRDGAYRYCLGMVGNAQESQDIVQEAFLAAFRGIGRLRPEHGFAGWFYGILRHLCLASLRKRQVCIEPEILTQLPEHGASPEQHTAHAEHRAALCACLSELTPKQREVLILRELEGLSYAEIATRLDVPAGTVMSRLYDARHALRSRMQRHPILKTELEP